MTEDVNAGLLAAVTTAVTEASPTPAESSHEDIETTGESTADTGAGGDTGAADGGAGDSVGAGSGEADGDAGDSGSDDVDESDPEAVAAAEASGRKRGADGKFAALTDEEKAAAAKVKADAKVEADKGKTPEQIAADVAAAKAANKKKPDAVNDPIPKGLKTETAQRMTSLIATVKEVTAKSEKVTKDLDYVMARIQESTATPQQYHEVLNVLKQLNSSDPAEKRKCLDYMQRSAAILAKQLGVVIPGVDVLAEHDDLKQEVQLGHISRARAEELAAARDRAKMENDSRTAQSTQQRDADARNAAVNAGKAALDTLETQLRSKDRDYDRKRAIVLGMLTETFQRLDPKEWTAAFQRAYDKVPNAPAARTLSAAVGGGNQPLRANKQPAGGQAKPPGSLLDAVNAGVAAASGAR